MRKIILGLLLFWSITVSAQYDVPTLRTKAIDSVKNMSLSSSLRIYNMFHATIYSYLNRTNNLSDLVSVGTARTNLGATTLGSNLFTVTNPSAVSFLRVNADNSVSMRSVSQMIADLGAQVALVSGTNIKTFAGATLLGSGDAGIVPLAYGGTGSNLSATGGTSNFLRQGSVGAAITVGTIGTADIVSTVAHSVFIGSSGTAAELSPGTNGQVLTIVSGTPSWSSGGGGGTVTSVTSATGDASVASSTTTPSITIISAPKLSTARNINTVAFDGTADITVTAAAGTLTGTTLNSTVVTSSLTSVGTLASGSLGSGITAVTQSPGTNNTSVGTTAFIQAALTAAALPAADATHDGYLTQTNWSTFNNKAPTASPTFTTQIISPIVYGGSGSGGNLTLGSTSNGTKGKIILGSTSAYDEVNDRLGLGQTTPATRLDVTNNALVATQSATAGISLNNTTAALVGVPVQISPPLLFSGFGWGTGAGTSQNSTFRLFNNINSSATPTGSLVFQHSLNGAGYTTPLTLSSTGAVTFSGALSGATTLSLTSTGNQAITLANGAGILFNTTGLISHNLGSAGSPANGAIRVATIQSVLAPISNIGVTEFGIGSTFQPLTSSTSTYLSLLLNPTINQLSGANGQIGVLRIDPTLTAVIGNLYPFLSVPTAGLNGFGTAAPTATLHVVGSTKLEGNLTLPVAGNGIYIKQGTNGNIGSTTLVAGTKAISISGLTTSDHCIPFVEAPSGTSLTTGYQCVCTSGTATIQANVAAGTINVSDVSGVGYLILHAAP